MTTTADLVAEARTMLTGRTRSMRNKLNGALTDSATSVVCEFDVTNITPGAAICIGLEVMQVVERTAATNTLTVLRGQDGSTAAAHADDATVYINPRFSDFSIFREINNELDFLSSPDAGLFQIATVDVSFNSARRGYDLTGVTAADFQEVYDISFKQPDGFLYHSRLRSYRVERDMPTADYASGLALFLNEGAYPGQSLRIRYKKRFAQLSALTDNVLSVTGLHSEAHRILPLGAAWRLVARDEVRRNNPDPQGESRRAEEVGSGSIIRSAAAVKAEHDEAVREEKNRLVRRYPVRL